MGIQDTKEASGKDEKEDYRMVQAMQENGRKQKPRKGKLKNPI